MKTVGTKLDNAEYEIFEFCCNENGLSKSEQLRDLIKNFVDNNDTELTKIKPTVRTEGIVTKMSYDDGETWNNVKPLVNPTVTDN